MSTSIVLAVIIGNAVYEVSKYAFKDFFKKKKKPKAVKSKAKK